LNTVEQSRKGRTMTTIEISKGNQYDANGYSITDGTLRSFGEIDNSKPKGYSVDGNLWPWMYPNEDEIAEAILATMRDGATRRVKIADNPKTTSPAPKFESTGFGLCSRCHTYCCGDCRS